MDGARLPPTQIVECLQSAGVVFFFSSRRRHTRCSRDWSSDVCSSDLYDRLGYASQDIQYTAIDSLPVAVAVRKEIARQEKRGDAPSFKRVLTALGVDRSSGEVWMALNNNLLHFDKAGNRLATYKIYAPGGARLEAKTILVQKDQLIIGSDPLGLYLFSRPDKKNTK